MMGYQKTGGVIPSSNEPPEQKEAKGDKRAHDDAVPPLLGRDTPNKRVDARHLARRQRDPPVDVGQRLALDAKVLVDRVRLAEDAVHHVVAVVDAAALAQHVLGLGCLARQPTTLSPVSACTVRVDVVADVRHQVDAVARMVELHLEAAQVAAVLLVLLAQQRQVILLDGRGCEVGVGVEDAGELADDVFSLAEDLLELLLRLLFLFGGLQRYRRCCREL